MIEREASIRIYNELLGAKGSKGKLVRVASEGFFEVAIDYQDGPHTTLLPIASTVIVAAEPEVVVAELDGVERGAI